MPVLRRMRGIERDLKRKQKFGLDILFLQRCLDQHLTPSFVKFRLSTPRLQGSRLYHRTQRDIMHNELTYKKRVLNKLRKLDVYNAMNSLPFTWLDRVRLGRIMSQTMEKHAEHTQRVHLKKLLNLGYNEKRHPPPDTVIFNLSDRVLTQIEEETLALGLNYAINPRTFPTTDFFLPFEKLFNRLQTLTPTLTPGGKEENVLTELKNIAWRHFKTLKSRGTRNNLSNKQMRTLRDLSRDDSTLFLRPDKGNGIVAMNREDYLTKMESILQDTSKFQHLENEDLYKLILKREERTTRLLKTLESDRTITAAERNFMQPSGTSPGTLYGLPKIHKTSCPMRPVLSAVNTFHYKLAKFLVPMIKPFSVN